MERIARYRPIGVWGIVFRLSSMKLSSRIFLAYFLIVGLGVYWFMNSLTNQLHPAVRQASEEALVDTANLLAELAADDLASGFITIGSFADAVEAYRARKLNATIWSHEKTQPDFTLYVTDLSGTVVFHTDVDQLGRDYSRWIDVKRTLEGEYGARTTRADPLDELSSSMYVASPVRFKGDIIGSLTVAQPNASVQPFLEVARGKIWQQGLLVLALALALGVLMSYWLTHSIRKLVEYVEDVRIGLRATPPKLQEKELAQLADSVESMRQALEGKEYVEHYIHTLTHEMKSPLAAIRGASELLQEHSMPAEEQQRFLSNIHSESHRMKEFIDRLLSLASVEKRNELDKPEPVDILELVQQELDAKSHALKEKSVTPVVTNDADKLVVMGESFLLQQALSNLLDNAIDFSEEGCELTITLENDSNQHSHSGLLSSRDTSASLHHVRISIHNIGEPIPDYAKQRIFERFYSLSRPSTGKKSSGLGLSFVKEVAGLHGGDVGLRNVEDGVAAIFSLPCSHV